MNDYDSFQNPLSSRYAGERMLRLFSPQKKFSTWRRLWIALARAQKQLGLPVTSEQISQMEAYRDDINFDAAEKFETELRHDVMAHIHSYGIQCPLAMPIIHLGATSCYVTDNTDIIIMKEGLELLCGKLFALISKLSAFSLKYRSLPTLGFTHFQPAQLTTVGKRTSLWVYDFLLDFQECEHRKSCLQLRGAKGATGTQASFLALFDGDHEKVRQLESMIASEMGFTSCVPVSGQTYSRKIDYFVVSALSGIAQSAGKFATDMRLLSHLKELEEPFEGKQVGSSAMPYKRNPMRSERICGLARYVLADAMNPAMTAYNQWLERTLDDSSNRRISIAEAFLATDAILNLCINIASGIKVHEKVIEKHVFEELPFIGTENILMDAVRRGGNRQDLHERIRQHSVAAGKAVKEQGLQNDLISRISGDPAFGLTQDEIIKTLSPEKYTGRATEQVEEFYRDHVKPVLDRFPELPDEEAELKV